MKKTGDTIRFNGREAVLGEALGGGGEGTVFKIELPGKVNGEVKMVPAAVKIIDTKKKTDQEVERIRRQIIELIDVRKASKEKATTPHSGSLNEFLIMPQFLLDGDLGYVMKLVTGFESLTKYISIPKEESMQEEWQRKYDLHRRYRVIAHLFERLEKIHIDGLVFSDLSPNNIMVSMKSDDSIRIIDTDNMRTKANPFANVLGTPGFIAPELYKITEQTHALTEEEKGNVDSVYLLSEESDVYSAAVIAFELLTLNHPFKGVKAVGDDTTPEDELDAEKGKFDYILKPGTGNYCEGNIFVDKFNEITTPEIRDLFMRTFVDGRDNPLRRPSANEFKREFQRARGLIFKCPYCGEESIYSTSFDGRGKLRSTAVCINPDCEKPISGQLLLSIYAIPNDQSVDYVILGESEINPGKKPVVLTQIVLREKEEHWLYLPDIGISGDLKADDRFGRMVVSGEKAIIDIVKPLDGSTIEIVSKEKKPSVPVTKYAEFPYEHDFILFQNIRTSHGTIKIVGAIQRV